MRPSSRRGAASAGVAALLMLVATPSPASAAVTDACGSGAAEPGGIIRDVPWAQTWLDPARLEPMANGFGQTVAVIDSGADGRHPQLRGRVLPGWDVLRKAPDNNVDCISHGTAVASLIAATPQPNIGLRGVAPKARILPVRVTDINPDTTNVDPRRPSPTVVAAAIEWATGQGATVIDVSPSFTGDNTRLRTAVAKAVSAGVVIVAAVGDRDVTGLPTAPASYPASYPDVIGVAAVDQTFSPTTSSAAGPEVKVMAPGDGLIAATRQQGYDQFGGTSFAAAFVAATAALVRQSWPALTPRQVAAQIIATADPSPSGQGGTNYGFGIVNPYRAITEPIVGSTAVATPVPVAGISAPVTDQAAEARARWWDRMSNLAVIITGSAMVLLIMITAAAVAMVRGRGRRWVPARTHVPDHVADPDSAAGADESDLFAVPSPVREPK